MIFVNANAAQENFLAVDYNFMPAGFYFPEAYAVIYSIAQSLRAKRNGNIVEFGIIRAPEFRLNGNFYLTLSVFNYNFLFY